MLQKLRRKLRSPGGKHPLFRLRNLLIVLIALTVAGTGMILSTTDTKAAPTADAIFNYPAGTPTDIGDPSITFQNFYQSFYDAAYTDYAQDRYRPPLGYYPNGTAGFYNGGTLPAAPNHIKLTNTKMEFFGYFSAPYFDAMVSNDKVTELDFKMNYEQWNQHCFKRTGFFINSRVDPVTHLVTGYMVSIGYTNPYVEQNASQGYGTALTFDLFYVEDMDIQAFNDFITSWDDPFDLSTATGTYTDPDTGTIYPTVLAPTDTHTTSNHYFDASNLLSLTAYMDSSYGLPAASSVTLVQRVSHSLFDAGYRPAIGDWHFTVQSSAGKFKVIWNNCDIISNPTNFLAGSCTLFDITGAIGTDQGFGFYTQYLQHFCPWLTYISYNPVTVRLQTGDPTSATVNFVDKTNGTVIADPQTINGFVGDDYYVNPPATITYGGETYYYYDADRAVLDPITYQTDPADNVTTLRYVRKPAISKESRVLPATGFSMEGTSAAPASAPYGGTIEYRIAVYNPNSAAVTGYGVNVSDILPTGVTYVSANPAPGRIESVSGGRTQLVWGINTLNAGMTYITVQVAVNALNTTFQNFATLTPVGTNGAGANPVTSNSVYHRATATDPTITKTARVLPSTSWQTGSDATPIEAEVGDQVEYLITVINPNNIANLQVTIADYLPLGMIYVSDDHSAAVTSVAGQPHLVWNIAALANGTTEIKVIAEVEMPNQLFVNWATITITGQTPVDSNKTYHQSEGGSVAGNKTSRVLPGTTQETGTSGNPVEVNANDQVEYDIKVTNKTGTSTGVGQLTYNYTQVHSLYDSAYTAATSAAALGAGNATSEHIVKRGTDLFMFGYGLKPYIDMVYTNELNVQQLDFTFVPALLGTHTYKRSGFFINSAVDHGKLTGYIVSLGFEGDPTNLSQTQYAAQAYYVIYKVTNMDIEAYNQYADGLALPQYGIGTHTVSNATMQSTFAPYLGFPFADEVTLMTTMNAASKMDVPNISGGGTLPSSHFRVISDPDRIRVYITKNFDQPTPDPEVLLFDLAIPYTNYAGAGFFMENNYHSCSILTQVQYKDVVLINRSQATNGVKVEDVIPKGMTLVSTDCSIPGVTPTVIQPYTDPVTGEVYPAKVIWEVDPLEEGDHHFYIKVQVDPDRHEVVDYVNTAIITPKDKDPGPTNSTYHEMRNKQILHIRQIVVNRNTSTIEVPSLGYYTMTNDGKKSGLVSLSGIDGNPLEFETYRLPYNANDDFVFSIVDLVPQYYEYVGRVITDANTPHNSASRVPGNIILDYNLAGEYWVTVYIQPTTAPKPHSWDVRTNDIGTIHPLTY
ncbi:MAG: DUF11 domain-containing protein [Oscillospiraceae bacterium]|jgi:uncharacterized repeat protein (TIGR01451 family)|nr:DUF11 domain-containing protein [Oscillospiraceae bacterium]